jgi:glycosyltransferase involved in cell wall biosynthesis
MNNPLISIITVVYNGVSTLEQTILIVINQTYKNIEYIIIDGGSIDGTVDIIKKYEDKLAYWVSEPDKGIYDAMNKGIDKATGEWINFMNAGDCFNFYNILEDGFQMNISNMINVIYSDTLINRRKKGLDKGRLKCW